MKFVGRVETPKRGIKEDIPPEVARLASPWTREEVDAVFQVVKRIRKGFRRLEKIIEKKML